MPARNSRAVDIDFILRRIFGKTSFRPRQREIINAALEGHDVFVQAATSFGKSLCYQLPAVIDHGITIVISPLLSLMNNQVAALKKSGVAVATLNSNTAPSERTEILNDLKCGHPLTRLLYITPEYTLTSSFRQHLATIHSQGEFSRIAIDEAHCISEWGHDFRPAYQNLSYFRETFPDVPVICLTATATRSVRENVIKTLALDPDRLKVFCAETCRPNLHFSVQYCCSEEDNRFDTFVAWLKGVYDRRRASVTADGPSPPSRVSACSGIIYVLYRTDTENLAQRLRERSIGAAPYHAGLSALEREACQRKWLNNEEGYDIIVATTAFGMGIDKHDVRFVVHWSIPKSFEGYYQEAGRAGRDGKSAACMLYYSREERERVAARIPNSDTAKNATQATARYASFKDLVRYCEDTSTCRHKFIAGFFGDDSAKCDYACDFCKDGELALARRKRKGLASDEFASSQAMVHQWAAE